MLVRDFRLGLGYGYPLCCVLHYCWDGIWGWPSSMTRWNQIATDPSDPLRCVACGVFHDGGSPLTLTGRLRAIVRFNRLHLSFTQTARSRRGLVMYGSIRWRQATPEEKRWFSDQQNLEKLYWDDGGLDPELDWR